MKVGMSPPGRVRAGYCSRLRIMKKDSGYRGPEGTSGGSGTQKQTGLSRRRERAKEQGGPRSTATRAKLMNAAGEVFRDYGLSRMSLQKVADRAGVDRATIYYHFASKESLFKELVYMVVMANVADAESIAASSLSVEEKLRRVIRGLMRSLAEHDPYAAVYVEEYLSRRDREPAFPEMEEVRLAARRYDQAVTRIVHEGIETGTFKALSDERTLMSMILGMVNSSVRWLREPTVVESLRAADVMAELVLCGLSAER
ncbi:MAG TPA: TetR/AcrR family transcriptional regulator [Acidimicrobiales bacterium]|jgi:AcrR family transcriptional regulator|nr:TetR/AcrR family transcriptional regulator [Acidimicrobiales bacterium]